jgi:hypothetical protein
MHLLLSGEVRLCYIEEKLETVRKGATTMSGILPEGEEIRKAVKWVSETIKENPDQPVQPLVQQAIFRFNLSPKDAEFLISFFSSRNEFDV